MKTFNLLKKTIGAFLLVMLIGSAAQAQVINDIMSLQNPKRVGGDVWKKLEASPTDQALWVEYMGKNLDALSKDEYEDMNLWKQILMFRRLAQQDAIVGLDMKGNAMSSGFFIDDFAFNELVQAIEVTSRQEEAPASGNGTSKGPRENALFIKKELMGMEVIIMRENENLKNLKSNVHENFALIEDMYRDLFKQFNESYTYYAKAHPKSDLNKTIWVDKQDEKLKALKMKQLDLLYKSYTSE